MRTLDIDRFECTVAPDGDVLLSFMGAVRLSEDAPAVLEGRHLRVTLSDSLAVRFGPLSEENRAAVLAAPRLYVNRTFKDDTDQFVEILLPMD